MILLTLLAVEMWWPDVLRKFEGVADVWVIGGAIDGLVAMILLKILGVL